MNLRQFRENRDFQELVLFALALIVVIITLNFPVVHFEFLNLDDQPYIQTNPIVHPRQVPDFLKVVDWNLFRASGLKSFFPVRDFTLACDYFLHGLNPGWFHLTNVMLHALFVLGAFLFSYRRLRFSPLNSFLTAALFASCPIVSEIPGWIFSRKVCLMAIFSLLYLDRIDGIGARDSRFFNKGLLSSLFLLLAALSHPFGVLLPLFGLCYVWFQGGLVKRFWRLLCMHLFIVVVPLGVAVYGAISAGIFAELSLENVLSRFLVIPYFFYVIMAPFQINPAVSHGYLVHHWNVFLPVFIVIVLAGFLVYRRLDENVKRFVLFSAGMILIVFVPSFVSASTAVPISLRYCYLPTFFLFLMLVSVLTFFIRKAAWCVFLVVVLVAYQSCFYGSVLHVFGDSVSLWKKAVAMDPYNLPARINLVKAYLTRGDLKLMEMEFAWLHRMFPGCGRCFSFHGTVLRGLGDCREAIAYYEIAQRIDPQHEKSEEGLRFCRDRLSRAREQ